jgi:hypothetical protein
MARCFATASLQAEARQAALFQDSAILRVCRGQIGDRGLGSAGGRQRLSIGALPASQVDAHRPEQEEIDDRHEGEEETELYEECPVNVEHAPSPRCCLRNR